METTRTVSAQATPARRARAHAVDSILATQPSMAAISVSERRQICRLDLAVALREIAAMRSPKP